MRVFQFLSAVLLTASLVGSARAQFVTNDSANAVIYQQYGEKYPEFAQGPPDGLSAHLDSNGVAVLDLAFSRDTSKHRWLPILGKSRIKIYGSKDPNVDSSAAQIQFIRIDPLGGGELYSSGFYIASPGVTTITLPDSQYTYLEFTLTGGGTKLGSRGFFLDAVTLFQDFRTLSVGATLASHVAGLNASYPNPFVSASGQAQINYSVLRDGDAMLVVTDAIGREVRRQDLGHVARGDHSTYFRGNGVGVYFARLILNGVPYGSTLKLTSVR